MVEIKILKTDVVFSLVFGKNSKKKDMHMIWFFWKRTIIMVNKDDHKSCVLTQICIAYNLILTCRWYVTFDVNIFSDLKTNRHFTLHDRYCLHMLQTMVMYSFIHLSLAILRYT